MPNDYEQLKMRVEMLERLVADLQQFNLITPEFRQVLDRSITETTSKVIGDETQAVNEAGSASYNVPTLGNGFIKIGGYNIMYWT